MYYFVLYVQRKGVSFVDYFIILSASNLHSVKWKDSSAAKTVIPSFQTINSDI
jgi:hypothetical protein